MFYGTFVMATVPYTDIVVFVRFSFVGICTSGNYTQKWIIKLYNVNLWILLSRSIWDEADAISSTRYHQIFVCVCVCKPKVGLRTAWQSQTFCAWPLDDILPISNSWKDGNVYCC